MEVPLKEIAGLVDLLTVQAARYGQKTAFVYHRNGEQVEATYTYQQLLTKAQAIAARLQSTSFAGNPVLLAYKPGLDFIAGFFGCLLSGSIAVPVVPPRNNRNATSFNNIAVDSTAHTVLSDSNYGVKLKAILADQPHSLVKEFVFTDQVDDAEAVSWTAPQIEADNIAFLQYTSGSTSDPKGVMVSHANLLHNLSMLRRYFQLDDQDRLVNWLPHFHDMGLIGNLLLSLYCGARCDVLAPSAFVNKPFNWLRIISEISGTYSGAPNFGYQICVDRITQQQLETLDLSSWRNAYCGSEPIRSRTLIGFNDKFKKAGLRDEAIFPCYGMAEATLIISGGSPDQKPVYQLFDYAGLEHSRAEACDTEHADTIRLVGCGQPAGGQSVIIVDPDTGAPLDAGHVGEIWVHGGSVSQGYWRNDTATTKAFRARVNSVEGGFDCGFVRSGDLGFMYEGQLYVSGRIKELIIINGKNYYPQDIELVVAGAHPALGNDGGAAFSIEKGEGGEQVVITHEVVRARVRDYHFDDIRRRVCAALAETFEIDVAAFVLLKPGRVLKTSSGKIKRSACKIAYLNNRLETLDVWLNPAYTNQPAENASHSNDESETVDLHDVDAVQDWLIKRITRYQSVAAAELQIDRPIMEYGLTSVTVMKILGDISQQVGCEVEPTLIWEYPDIDGLSKKIVSMA